MAKTRPNIDFGRKVLEFWFFLSLNCSFLSVCFQRNVQRISLMYVMFKFHVFFKKIALMHLPFVKTIKIWKGSSFEVSSNIFFNLKRLCQIWVDDGIAWPFTWYVIVKWNMSGGAGKKLMVDWIFPFAY